MGSKLAVTKPVKVGKPRSARITEDCKGCMKLDLQAAAPEVVLVWKAWGVHSEGELARYPDGNFPEATISRRFLAWERLRKGTTCPESDRHDLRGPRFFS